MFSIFGAVGLFRSDMLLIFNMVWPCFSCRTVCVCPQFPYRGNDTILWIFPIVHCQAICMWHWPIGKDFNLSFFWGHHHLHTVSLWISVDQLNIAELATPCREETQQGPNNCPRLQFGYRVVAPLSFLRSINLVSLLSVRKYSWTPLIWAPQFRIPRHFELKARHFIVLSAFLFVSWNNTNVTRELRERFWMNEKLANISSFEKLCIFIS